MCKAIEDMQRKSEEVGIEKGIERGEELNKINLVIKKHSKGKSPEIIADELEENVAYIKVIIKAIDSVDGMVTKENVYAVLHS